MPQFHIDHGVALSRSHVGNFLLASFLQLVFLQEVRVMYKRDFQSGPWFGGFFFDRASRRELMKKKRKRPAKLALSSAAAAGATGSVSSPCSGLREPLRAAGKSGR